DIVFAVDSVPAVFAFTSEPLIVFTSNIFAILGLRALYFLLAGAVEKFYLLRYGLGTVLIFVGLKMVWLNQLFDGKLPIGISLGIIAAVIAASIVLSLAFPRAESTATATLDERLGDEPATRDKQRSPATATKRHKRKRPPPSATRVLWKTLGFYLLLLGLALIAGAAFGD